MDETIVSWVVAITVAGFAALIIYSCVSDFVDDDAIRRAAETGAVFVALGFTAAFLKK